MSLRLYYFNFIFDSYVKEINTFKLRNNAEDHSRHLHHREHLKFQMVK
jgi:hypothetical protein